MRNISYPDNPHYDHQSLFKTQNYIIKMLFPRSHMKNNKRRNLY